MELERVTSCDVCGSDARLNDSTAARCFPLAARSAYLPNDPSTATTAEPEVAKLAETEVLVCPMALTYLPVPPENWNAPLPLNDLSPPTAESHSMPLNPTLIVAPPGNFITPSPDPGRHRPLTVPFVTDWLRSKFRSIVSVDFPSTADLRGIVICQQ